MAWVWGAVDVGVGRRCELEGIDWLVLVRKVKVPRVSEERVSEITARTGSRGYVGSWSKFLYGH